jgi:hypothetical protein
VVSASPWQARSETCRHAGGRIYRTMIYTCWFQCISLPPARNGARITIRAWRRLWRERRLLCIYPVAPTFLTKLVFSTC